MNASSLYAQSFGSWQIAAASVFILLAMAISRFFRLHLEKDVFIASLRTCIQLIVVGSILRWLFHADSLPVNLLTYLVMTLVAAQAAHSRLKEKTLKIYFGAAIVLLAAVWPIAFICVAVFFGGEAFHQSLFFIPFVGILLGNTLSAISLALVGLERARRENLLEVETMKALGATPFEACHRLYSDILRSALTPNMNAMMVVGIVSLPGMMAGQLIGGVDPLVAARFQILVMFSITLTVMVGSLFAVILNHFFLMPPWVLQKPEALCFQFAAGEKVLLRGPSGVGKSRLLKSLVGLDTPEIRKDLSLSAPLEFCHIGGKSVYYVPQKPFFVPGTVLENLRFPLQFKKYAHIPFDEAFFEKNLRELGMGVDILQKNALTLSGGEAQIVHLLRTLQLDPHILLLDEITAALDAERARLVETYLTTWVRATADRGLVFISHRSDQAQSFADRVMTLEQGKLLLQ